MLPGVSRVFLILALCFGAAPQTAPETDMNAAIAAIKAGNIEELRRLLTKSPGLAQASDKKYRATLLHWAADEKNLEAVTLLIDKGASPAAQNNERATPLQLAILPNPAKPSVPDLLDIVKKLSDTEVVKLANIDRKTPLHLACQYGHLEVAEFLIKEMKADVYVRTNTDKEPLDYARASKNVELVKLLEAEKARLSLTTPTTPTPPPTPTPSTTTPTTPTPPATPDSSVSLHDAARDGDLEAVKSILRAHPGWKNSRNAQWETPLHTAAKNRRLAVIAELIKQGADVTLRDDKDKTFWDLLCLPPPQ